MVKIVKILFPSELREYSLKILPYVLSMSEKYNSTIYLLHVIDDSPPAWHRLSVCTGQAICRRFS